MSFYIFAVYEQLKAIFLLLHQSQVKLKASFYKKLSAVSPFPGLFAFISSTHLVIRLYRFRNKHSILCLCSTSQEDHRITISAGKAGGDLGNGKLGQPGSGTVTPLSVPEEPLKTLLSSKELGFCNAVQAVSAEALSWPAQD